MAQEHGTETTLNLDPVEELVLVGAFSMAAGALVNNLFSGWGPVGAAVAGVLMAYNLAEEQKQEGLLPEVTRVSHNEKANEAGSEAVTPCNNVLLEDEVKTEKVLDHNKNDKAVQVPPTEPQNKGKTILFGHGVLTEIKEEINNVNNAQKESAQATTIDNDQGNRVRSTGNNTSNVNTKDTPQEKKLPEGVYTPFGEMHVPSNQRWTMKTALKSTDNSALKNSHTGHPNPVTKHRG